MEKVVFFDPHKFLYADVNKQIVEGRLFVSIKVKTNVKLVCANLNSNVLVDVYFDSIDERYMRKLYRSGANIYAASIDGLYSMFSINLN